MKKYFTRSQAKQSNLTSSDSDDSNTFFLSPEQDICDFNIESPSRKSKFYNSSDSETEGKALKVVTNTIGVQTLFELGSENSRTNDFPMAMNNNPPLQPSILDKSFALKFIPEFSGTRDELHKFINCCDLLYDENHNLADKELLLNIIKCKLTGAAYNVTKYKEFDSWQELRAILSEQFLELRTYAQLQNDLINCRQNYKENVRSYANRIEKLLSNLNDVCVANEGEAAKSVVTRLNSKTALKSFVDGLLPPIRLTIKASRFEELNRAIEAAIEEEKSIPNSSKNSNMQANHKPKCSYCQKVGHLSSSCFFRPNTNLPRFNNTPRVEIKREPRVQSHNVHVLTCSYCKNRGHHIKDCRKRAYNETKRVQNQNSTTYIERTRQGNETRPGVNEGATRASSLKNQ